MPKRSNAMGDPIPFVVCLLLLTRWTSLASVTPFGRGSDLLRRIDSAEADDWKPIDYGHPMRDDPTLVYVPPVVDPVHYGIMTAEPLWPIKASKVPSFVLPPEALGSDSNRRFSAGFRPVSPAKMAQQRLDEAVRHFERRPVQQNRRQDAQNSHVYPRMPVVPLQGWTDRERPKDNPHLAGRTANVRRPYTAPPVLRQREQIAAPPAKPHPLPSVRLAVDRLDNEAEAEEQDKNNSAKRARKPFRPFDFVIQQGHSKVRKYSAADSSNEQQKR